MAKQNKSGNWRALKKWKSSSCFREDLMAESASSTRSFFISATTLHRSASSSSGAIARTAMETRYRWENKGTLRKEERLRREMKLTNSDLWIWRHCRMQKPGCACWASWTDLRGEEEGQVATAPAWTSEPLGFRRTKSLNRANANCLGFWAAWISFKEYWVGLFFFFFFFSFSFFQKV